MLTNTLGGSGSSNATFSDPITITTDDENNLYVVDGNLIKHYDDNINWKKTYNLAASIGTGTIVDMEYSSSNSTFYILLTTGILLEYDTAFVLRRSTQLSEVISEDFIGTPVPHVCLLYTSDAADE